MQKAGSTAACRRETEIGFPLIECEKVEVLAGMHAVFGGRPGITGMLRPLGMLT
jgi:hypothetical protein